MELPEFINIVKRCRKMPEDYFGRYNGPTCFLLQFHMIARLDDVEEFFKDLTANMEYSYTLKSKMRWRKNIF